MRILIAIPTSGNIETETFKSIYDLDKCGHDCAFHVVTGYDCASSRNLIAKYAIENSFDYVLMVDSDVVLPADALRLMLENPVDVCLCAYASKLNGHYDGKTCLCKKYRLDGQEYYNYPVESLITHDELSALSVDGINKLQIHGGGFGCALIKTEIFTKKLSYPWFKWVEYEDGHGVLSEDLFFCEKCHEAGIPVFTDVRVRCGHVFRNVQELI